MKFYKTLWWRACPDEFKNTTSLKKLIQDNREDLIKHWVVN